MFTQARSRPADNSQWRRFQERTIAGLTALAATALLAGCSLTPPVAGPDPSDPNVRVRPVGYRSTIGSYKSQRPVSPSDWREQNERVAPRSGQ